MVAQAAQGSLAHAGRLFSFACSCRYARLRRLFWGYGDKTVRVRRVSREDTSEDADAKSSQPPPPRHTPVFKLETMVHGHPHSRTHTHPHTHTHTHTHTHAAHAQARTKQTAAKPKRKIAVAKKKKKGKAVVVEERVSSDHESDDSDYEGGPPTAKVMP